MATFHAIRAASLFEGSSPKGKVLRQRGPLPTTRRMGHQCRLHPPHQPSFSIGSAGLLLESNFLLAWQHGSPSPDSSTIAVPRPMAKALLVQPTSNTLSGAYRKPPGNTEDCLWILELVGKKGKAGGGHAWTFVLCWDGLPQVSRPLGEMNCQLSS